VHGACRAVEAIQACAAVLIFACSLQSVCCHEEATAVLHFVAHALWCRDQPCRHSSNSAPPWQNNIGSRIGASVMFSIVPS
jgi:hypothetical protein